MKPTLLFVDGHPVAYTLEREGDHYILYPCHDTHPDVEPPSLTAYYRHGAWTIEGCHCRDLYDQVVEELEMSCEQDHLTPALS